MPCAGTGFFSISYVPSRPMVSGNAAATDQNILASERLFRLGIVSELICAVEFIFLLWVLYRSLWRGEQDVCFAIVILGYGLRSCAVAFIQRGNNISLLRKALGEDPPYVETVPKRGYRFIGAVRRLPPGSFVEEGNLTNYSRAFDYIHTEIGSEWADAVSIQILLRECKKKEALQISEPHIPQWNSYNMLVACVQQKPSSEITSLASLVRVSDDAETNYFSASHLAYCGQNTSALQMLRQAIKGNYCSYPAIDSDSFFDSVRGDREFAELRSAAIACQNSTEGKPQRRRDFFNTQDLADESSALARSKTHRIPKRTDTRIDSAYHNLLFRSARRASNRYFAGFVPRIAK